jgi:acetylornithine deacetylase/succinyl-diaminopimelate desuccinylase-like protein
MKRFLPTSILLATLTAGLLAADLSADSSALSAHVSFLTALDPPRSVYHLSSLDSASSYIEKQFRRLSGNVEIRQHRVSHGSVRNLILSFGPESGPRVIVGAHYDVAGNQPGADDNASGIAGLLELARMLSQVSDKLTKRIDLVAYTLEEPPFFRTEYMGASSMLSR